MWSHESLASPCEGRFIILEGAGVFIVWSRRMERGHRQRHSLTQENEKIKCHELICLSRCHTGDITKRHHSSEVLHVHSATRAETFEKTVAIWDINTGVKHKWWAHFTFILNLFFCLVKLQSQAILLQRWVTSPAGTDDSWFIRFMSCGSSVPLKGKRWLYSWTDNFHRQRRYSLCFCVRISWHLILFTDEITEHAVVSIRSSENGEVKAKPDAK